LRAFRPNFTLSSKHVIVRLDRHTWFLCCSVSAALCSSMLSIQTASCIRNPVPFRSCPEAQHCEHIKLFRPVTRDSKCTPLGRQPARRRTGALTEMDFDQYFEIGPSPRVSSQVLYLTEMIKSPLTGRVIDKGSVQRRARIKDKAVRSVPVGHRLLKKNQAQYEVERVCQRERENEMPRLTSDSESKIQITVLI
jgi:hypothetical protein